MEEVVSMYAMSDGDPTGEPKEMDPDRVEDFADEEEEEVETASIVTSSDDDEVVGEVIEVQAVLVPKPAAVKPAKK
jgi:hypothetical protein